MTIYLQPWIEIIPTKEEIESSYGFGYTVWRLFTTNNKLVAEIDFQPKNNLYFLFDAVNFAESNNLEELFEKALKRLVEKNYKFIDDKLLSLV